MTKHVVAISGKAGSGKTTVAKELARKLNLRYVSAGLFFRKLCKERGVDFQFLHKEAENDPSIDKKVDDMLRKEAEKGNVVLEGRLACWMAAENATVKVYLFASEKERVKRIAERDNLSYEEALKQILKREESNKRRYLKYYSLDPDEASICDILINSSKWKPHQIVEIIKKAYFLREKEVE